VGVLGERLLVQRGGIVIPWASSWSLQFCGACGNGGLSVSEACNEVVPVFFIKGFVNPVLEGAIIINGDFRDVREKKTKSFDDVILVVKEGVAYTTNIVAARSHLLLGWTVVWPTHCSPKKIKLASSNHVANARDVVLLTCLLCRCSSFTQNIDMQSIRQIFRWRNTSSLFERAFRIDQVSHPHKSRFMGIARMSKYLLHM
jgi:hypothetical protein